MDVTRVFLVLSLAAFVTGTASAEKQEPFQFTARADWVEGSRSASESFQVPSRKRLVIEHVSASISVLEEQEVLHAAVITVAGGERAHHYFFIPKAATFDLDVDNLSPGAERTEGNSRNIYTGGDYVRLYADPGTAVDIGVTRNDSICRFPCGTAIVVISGYLLDPHSPSLEP